MGCLCLFALLSCQGRELDHLWPGLDAVAARIDIARAQIAPEREKRLAGYFLEPIPRVLHLRAGAGGLDPVVIESWMAYCLSHGYRARTWNLDDRTHVEALLGPSMSQLLQDLGAAGRGRAVGDLVGYAALAAEGGVLVGPRLRPPRWQGRSVAWHRWVPMHGMVLSPEARARDIGKGEALHVGLDLLMSAPAHPNLQHLLAAIEPHLRAARVDGPGALADDYLAGSVVFNRALGGAYTLLPRRMLAELGALAPAGAPPLHAATAPAGGRSGGVPEALHAWQDPAAALSMGVAEEPLEGERPAVADWAPVPRRVHQIWLGDPARRPRGNNRLWERWARELGYGYRLWSEADMGEIEAMMSADSRRVFHHTLDKKVFEAAADVLRLSILAHHGGIYIDCDHRPPRTGAGDNVDMATFLPMRGLALMTEGQAREIGTDSLFAGNSLIIAPVGHALVARAVRHLPRHFDALLAGLGAIDSWRSTGPMLVNRLLAGPLTVLPLSLGAQYDMFDEADAPGRAEVAGHRGDGRR